MPKMPCTAAYPCARREASAVSRSQSGAPRCVHPLGPSPGQAIGMSRHQIGCPKPHGQRQLGMVHNGSGSHRGLPVAAGAFPGPRLGAGAEPVGWARPRSPVRAPAACNDRCYWEEAAMIDWPQVTKDVTAQLRSLRADAPEVMKAFSSLLKRRRPAKRSMLNQGADRARHCRGGALR
jgi:hypothetical protein